MTQKAKVLATALLTPFERLAPESNQKNAKWESGWSNGIHDMMALSNLLSSKNPTEVDLY